jgi:large conductance mechanosensitive channel
MESSQSLPQRKKTSLLEEFKNFAFKGNVIALAVAVVIGAAFAKIIDSLVDQELLTEIRDLLKQKSVAAPAV